MSSMRLPSFLLLAAAIFLASCGGGEKKDPNGTDPKESNDSTASRSDKDDPEITAAKFANAVRKRILEKAKANDGVLHLPDPRNDADTLKVELKKVVESTVSKSAENVRYVCAKFKGVEDGKDYDIDFFLKGNEPSTLEPTRGPILHKVNGRARYEYVKKNGVKKPRKVADSTE